MVDITVIRGNGDWPGADIVEPLLSTVAAALARGRMELDEGSAADNEELTLSPCDVRLGETIEVNDPILGVWKGKCTRVTHKFSIDGSGNAEGSTELTVRKPR